MVMVMVMIIIIIIMVMMMMMMVMIMMMMINIIMVMMIMPRTREDFSNVTRIGGAPSSLVPPGTAPCLPSGPARWQSRQASEEESIYAALLAPVVMEGESLETVYPFDYLGCRFTSDGDDAADMRHRMAIAGERSRSLDYMWRDNRLSRSA